MKTSIAKEKNIPQVIEIISKRIDWFKEKNINQWQHGYLDWFNEEYCKELVSKNELYIVESNDNIIGTFALLNEDEEYWQNGKDGKALYIHHFATDPKYKGIGAQILKYMEQVAKNNGKECLRLDCLSTNKDLNDYYLGFGFEQVGVFYESKNYIATLREKPLTK